MTENTMVLPKLWILGDDETEKDTLMVANWEAEGFDVSYIPFVKTDTQNGCDETLQDHSSSSDQSEKHAIIAYGRAASAAFQAAVKPMNNLCALIAYYPDNNYGNYSPHITNLNVLLHIEGSRSELPSCRHYVYSDTKKGFAHTFSKTFDKVAAGLAWSRTLAVLRKGFDIEVDLEKVWEDHVALEFVTKDVDATMATMVAEPYVNHIPTMTGGIGYHDLRRFYRDYFIPGNPPSLKMKLLSRTVGTDRVVDEMYVSFKHTQIIPWLLPDVEPTNKEVEVALVAIICIRGGKLYHEHIYWDQASVLVQIGFLDPKMVSSGKRLPVVDGAGARKVMDERSQISNELIGNW